MDWNDLNTRERALLIRRGVALGYTSLDDIQNNMNSLSKTLYKTGGKKKTKKEPVQDMSSLNLEYFKKNLTRDDIALATLNGINILGMLAGAEVNGAENTLNSLRNTNGKNTSALLYMAYHSQSPEIIGDNTSKKVIGLPIERVEEETSPSYTTINLETPLESSAKTVVNTPEIEVLELERPTTLMLEAPADADILYPFRAKSMYNSFLERSLFELPTYEDITDSNYLSNLKYSAGYNAKLELRDLLFPKMDNELFLSINKFDGGGTTDLLDTNLEYVSPEQYRKKYPSPPDSLGYIHSSLENQKNVDLNDINYARGYVDSWINHDRNNIMNHMGAPTYELVYGNLYTGKYAEQNKKFADEYYNNYNFNTIFEDDNDLLKEYNLYASLSDENGNIIPINNWFDKFDNIKEFLNSKGIKKDNPIYARYSKAFEDYQSGESDYIKLRIKETYGKNFDIDSTNYKNTLILNALARLHSTPVLDYNDDRIDWNYYGINKDDIINYFKENPTSGAFYSNLGTESGQLPFIAINPNYYYNLSNEDKRRVLMHEYNHAILDFISPNDTQRIKDAFSDYNDRWAELHSRAKEMKDYLKVLPGYKFSQLDILDLKNGIFLGNLLLDDYRFLDWYYDLDNDDLLDYLDNVLNFSYIPYNSDYVNNSNYAAFGGIINTDNPILNYSLFKGGIPTVRYADGGNLFKNGGNDNTSYYHTDNTHLLNWPALESVPHHIVADSNWNNTIETFVPAEVLRIWPEEDTTKGYYANNPYPNETTILYNPNDKSVVDDTITLEGLHYMHNNPTYVDLYSDVFTAISKEPEALFLAINDLTWDDKESRELTKKVLNGEKLTSEDLEILRPAVDGFLRRLLAPDYMREKGLEHGYAAKYPMTGDLEKAVNNIQSLMESHLLPEVKVTNSANALGGNIPSRTNRFDTGGDIPEYRPVLSPAVQEAYAVAEDYNNPFNWYNYGNTTIMPEVVVEAIDPNKKTVYTPWYKYANNEQVAKVALAISDLLNNIRKATNEAAPYIAGVLGAAASPAVIEAIPSAINTMTEAVPAVVNGVTNTINGISNTVYPYLFTPSGTLTKGATDFLSSTLVGEALNNAGNYVSTKNGGSGNWAKDVDDNVFHGDFGYNLGEEGRDMLFTAPLYGANHAASKLENLILSSKKPLVKNATNSAIESNIEDFPEWTAPGIDDDIDQAFYRTFNTDLYNYRDFSNLHLEDLIEERSKLSSLLHDKRNYTRGQLENIEQALQSIDSKIRSLKPKENSLSIDNILSEMPIDEESIAAIEDIILNQRETAVPENEVGATTNAVFSPELMQALSSRFRGITETPYEHLYNENGEEFPLRNSDNGLMGLSTYTRYIHRVPLFLNVYDSQGNRIIFKGEDIFLEYPNTIIPNDNETVDLGIRYNRRGDIRRIEGNLAEKYPTTVEFIYDKNGNPVLDIDTVKDDLLKSPYYDNKGRLINFKPASDIIRNDFAVIDTGYLKYNPHIKETAYNLEELLNTNWWNNLEPSDITSTTLFNKGEFDLDTNKFSYSGSREVLNLIDSTIENMKHGQAFSEGCISRDAYPLEINEFIKNRNKGEIFIPTSTNKWMPLNSLAEVNKEKTTLEYLEYINKKLEKLRKATGKTIEEIPNARINPKWGLEVPRLAIRKYENGGNTNNIIAPAIFGLSLAKLPTSIEETRQRLYDNIDPTMDYEYSIPAVWDVIRGLDTHGKYPVHTNMSSITGNPAINLEIWGRYLLRDLPYTYTSEAVYNPINDSKNAYYKINLDLKGIDKLVNYGVRLPQFNKYLGTNILGGYGMNNHGVAKAVDPINGEYVAYKDSYDLNPFHGARAIADIPVLSSISDLSMGIGTPVNLYDRVYLDDYYGINTANLLQKDNLGLTTRDADYTYFGGYIPEISISTKAKKSTGGNITTHNKNTIHTVASGEMLGSIANKYGVTVSDIVAANKGLDMNRLSIGLSITIPAKKTYDKSKYKTNGPLNRVELAKRQAWAESKNDPNAVSHRGATGVFLIMDSTVLDYNKANGTNYTIKDMKNSALNKKVRDFAMNKLSKSLTINTAASSDSVAYAKQLAAYNWGKDNLGDFLDAKKKAGINIYDGWDWMKGLPKETSDYVNFILRNKNTGEHRNNKLYNQSKKAIGGPIVQEVNKLYKGHIGLSHI